MLSECGVEHRRINLILKSVIEMPENVFNTILVARHSRVMIVSCRVNQQCRINSAWRSTASHALVSLST